MPIYRYLGRAMADPIVKFTQTTSLTVGYIESAWVTYDRDPCIEAFHVMLIIAVARGEGVRRAEGIALGTQAQRDLVELALGVKLSEMPNAEAVKMMKSFDWKTLHNTKVWVELHPGGQITYLGWCKEA